MSEEQIKKMISPGQEAAKKIFDLINEYITEFIKENQPDSAWKMQYDIYCKLKERFER